MAEVTNQQTTKNQPNTVQIVTLALVIVTLLISLMTAYAFLASSHQIRPGKMRGGQFDGGRVRVQGKTPPNTQLQFNTQPQNDQNSANQEDIDSLL